MTSELGRSWQSISAKSNGSILGSRRLRQRHDDSMTIHDVMRHFTSAIFSNHINHIQSSLRHNFVCSLQFTVARRQEEGVYIELRLLGARGLTSLNLSKDIQSN